MEKHDALYERYLNILREELVPAMGCTEPIAVAYAAAIARDALGGAPDAVEVRVSPNILKNVKSVVVPHTGGLRGIGAAVAAGIAAGRAEDRLEVLSKITEARLPAVRACLETLRVCVHASESGFVFEIAVRAKRGPHSAFVQILGSHTNVVRVERDGEVLFSAPFDGEGQAEPGGREFLSVEGIAAFADCVEIGDVAPTLDRQIECNTAIAEAGFSGDWGANIGRVLLSAYGDSVHNRAKATAAAGSDARMSGCELPVVINSGSGNQGLTASLPVIVYAEAMHVDREKLYRALVVSNLVTIHLKTGIGRLSAYCGATSAGCGAGAGVCYLHGGRAREIAHTVVNAVAINSGMICDGAKASCAAKIASAVEAGLLGFQMQRQGSEFYGGDGIVEKGAENTIRNVGQLARVGMVGTDAEIIRIMCPPDGQEART